MQEINLASLAKHFSDEEAAYELVEDMRWHGSPVCPHCGEVGNAYYLKATNGYRTTKAGNRSYRRLWKCAACRKQFSVLVGTIFQDTKVPLSKWLLAIYLMAASKNGVAAFELHRTIGVTNKTAWFMCHRIREAMKAGPVADMLRGTIVADETWIGGDPKNRHANDKRNDPIPMGPGVNARTEKIPVLSLISTETGEVRSRVVTDVTGATLRKVISENVDMAGSVLHTDTSQSYVTLGQEFVAHHAVNHSDGEYVARNGASTNHAEGFFSQLKRSIDGTHHHVSVEHLPRYLAEFDFRYSTRKISDGRRMQRMMDQTGRRLTYRQISD